MKSTKITDLRGEKYHHFIEIRNNLAYYGGMPIDTLKQVAQEKSKFYYQAIGHNFVHGEIALSKESFKQVQEVLEMQSIELTRVASDINGNPRYACHFSNFINEGDRAKANHTKGSLFGIDIQYNIALYKAKAIGGRKYHNKQYGGGIVFQSYNIDDLKKSIYDASKLNINFKKEWDRKEMNKANKAITQHFLSCNYKVLTDHKEGKKVFDFAISSQCVGDLLGLAYTSSSSYAGLWVCNAFEVYATETHKFIGFAINELGQVVGIADNEKEESIYIGL